MSIVRKREISPNLQAKIEYAMSRAEVQELLADKLGYHLEEVENNEGEHEYDLIREDGDVDEKIKALEEENSMLRERNEMFEECLIELANVVFA